MFTFHQIRLAGESLHSVLFSYFCMFLLEISNQQGEIMTEILIKNHPESKDYEFCLLCD